jgi:ferric-dicitrate binding protein FerR (iron transport regulator)
MNINADIERLIVRSVTEILSPEEDQALQAWLSMHPDNREDMAAIIRVWQKSSGCRLFHAIKPEEDWQVVRQRMGFDNKSNKRLSLNGLLRVAAIMIPTLLILSSLFAYYSLPGFGRLVAAVSSEEVKEVVLPDESIVTLNAHSRIVFQKTMNGDQRLVKLDGEAWFDVAKNPEKPFVIRAADAHVQVLGTAFNLEVKGDIVSIHVAEGEVKFWQNEHEVILTKGEKAVFDGNEIVKNRIFNDNYFSWKSGVMRFNQASLEEILNALVDHFQVVEGVDAYSFDDKILVTTRFENQPIHEVIEELQIHFGKKIALQDGFLHISD